MFFIRGQTDSKILESKGVNIWKGNTSREFLDSIDMPNRREGLMGPMYGYQWRHYNSSYNEDHGIHGGVDQLQYVIDLIINDPSSRRIMMTTFNPSQVYEGVLFPCHSIVSQFYVEGECLDMYCYNRSVDLFLGLPFNIASSSLLLILISKLTNKIPRKFILGLGDIHIYKEHYDAVKVQLSRPCYKFPNLEIKREIKSIKDLETLELSDVEIRDYHHHPAIKADMIS